ncbi:hypothetical protein M6D81_24600 [Paenibacillus sp. J5C_2022]|uniref:hypothetical protein n=1 Tax=Paenibacillus sp. J5C2022 TaxID=2977129 RepID=UPI0021CE00A7|nr:hypothetical protein [Paenibacillus sp. J5C2022]MCU6711886.1 hypothetical protein [Paenibacillus sp. J5C2022]
MSYSKLAGDRGVLGKLSGLEEGGNQRNHLSTPLTYRQLAVAMSALTRRRVGMDSERKWEAIMRAIEHPENDSRHFFKERNFWNLFSFTCHRLSSQG